MKKKKLKVFTLPIEEFEKKYPVSYSIVVRHSPRTCGKGSFCTPLLDFYNSEG